MHTPYDTRLPPHLRDLKQQIEGYAREYGLDFYETIFEVIDADDLNEVAAYGGFPTRYPHWSFGMAYEELRKGYDYGLSKIYEMVINNDPCYAYLMRSNHTVDQKLVMAHVYGHCDFFKNNAYFAHTNRKMMDEMANHGARIRSYTEKIGEDEVEAFVDRCMSIDDLIDIHSVAIRRKDPSSRFDFSPHPVDPEDAGSTRFKSKDYMDEYINPPGVLRAEVAARKKQIEAASRNFPENPEKDVLLFLIENAPLKPWQRDVLSIIRDEAYYFTPQGMTKVLNEGWACLSSEMFIVSNKGFLRIGELVQQRQSVEVSDGTILRKVYDWAQFPNRETIRIRTRLGIELHGANSHQIRMSNGTWKRLDEVVINDRVDLALPLKNSWADDYVLVDWLPSRHLTPEKIAEQTGLPLATVQQYILGQDAHPVGQLHTLIEELKAQRIAPVKALGNRKNVYLPKCIGERMGAFLGYLIGDGHISDKKRTIGLTTADELQADHFMQLTRDLFGIESVKKWDKTKWRVRFSSRTVQDYLVHLGLKTGFCAREKMVPDVILRSPRTVVKAFLSALYDCDGYAGKAGVILATSSTEMSKIVQLLLLNFGVLSTRRPHKDGCWHVHSIGIAARRFSQDVGFGLPRKQLALQKYIQDHKWFKPQPWSDSIVDIQQDRATVYDISVEESHRYVAQGFVNHNSYWHSTIMTQKALTPGEVIDYADHHSGTMAMSQTRLNPYKLGIELLRDIEMRWNTGRFGKEYEECDDIDKKRRWDKQLGLGRKKIFEVRRIHNDLTFIDTFLTPEFCVQHNFFTYAYQEQAGQYYIESRDFQKIKQRLLFSLTNFGKPWICVVDGNYRNRGELLLSHVHSGVDLRLDQAADTLANVQYIWSRPVHLNTLVDGKPTTLTFDGTDHSIRSGESDDARRNTPGKTR